MIDELDRCRPTFALDVLEKIKHIFDVPGVFFVAALNKNALAKTIESAYGITDGNEYLSKFFDDTHPLANDREIARYLVEKAGIFEMIKRDFRPGSSAAESIVSVLSKLFRSHSVFLRGQKQIVESIAGCLKKFAHTQTINWTLLFYFVFLRRRNLSLFDKTLATTKDARSDPELLSLVPARELMAFVYGQKSFSFDNLTEECKIVAGLASFSNSGPLAYIYKPLIYLRGQCDSEFHDKVAPRLRALHSQGRDVDDIYKEGDVNDIYDLVEKVSHNCDDKIR